MNKINRANGSYILLLIVMLFSTALMAENTKLANQGYSLVSYFENGIAEMGITKYSANFEDKTYWFTSKQQLDTFNADPHSYLPLFGEMCPYSLALGRKVAIDPTNFKIIGGQLLLFHRSDELDALKEWNQLDNDIDLLGRAESKFELLRFN